MRAAKLSLPPGVGNTPLIRLANPARPVAPDVEIWLKCEQCNLGGSSKARPAAYMVQFAIQSGRWQPGQRFLVPTAGSTGLSVALEAGRHGIATTLVMASNVSLERQRVAAAHGAELILTEPDAGSDGAYDTALRLEGRQQGRFCLLDQYADPANWLAHYDTTGPEIWRQTQGRLTHFVAPVGTTGTIIGIARYLRQQDQAVRIIAANPRSAAESIPGLRYLHGGQSRIPTIYDPGLIDQHTFVSTDRAWQLADQVCHQNGLPCGPSGGAAVAGALELAASLERGCIVALIPDGLERNLSTRPGATPVQPRQRALALSMWHGSPRVRARL